MSLYGWSPLIIDRVVFALSSTTSKWINSLFGEACLHKILVLPLGEIWNHLNVSKLILTDRVKRDRVGDAEYILVGSKAL